MCTSRRWKSTERLRMTPVGLGIPRLGSRVRDVFTSDEHATRCRGPSQVGMYEREREQRGDLLEVAQIAGHYREWTRLGERAGRRPHVVHATLAQLIMKRCMDLRVPVHDRAVGNDGPVSTD